MSQLRHARLAAGLSQAALASAAGLSRQTVGAVEAGQTRPSVDAAIALAWPSAVPSRSSSRRRRPRAMRCSSRRPPRERACLLAGSAAGWCTLQPSVHFPFSGWPAANAVMRAGRPSPLPGADLEGYVVVGCDPALGLAAAMLPQTGPRHLIALAGSTGSAIEAMRSGRAHGALVHDEPGRLPAAPRGTLRLRLARWRVGSPSRRRPRSVEELVRPPDTGRAARGGCLQPGGFVAAAAAAGLAPPAGPRAAGHLEVADVSPRVPRRESRWSPPP